MKKLHSIGFLKHHASLIAEIQHLLDPILCVGLFLFFYDRFQSRPEVHAYLFSSILFFLAYVLFDKFDIYRSWRGSTLGTEIRKLLSAAVLFFLIAFTLERVFPAAFKVSDRVFLWWTCWTSTTLVGIRGLTRLGLRLLRKYGKNTRSVVIAGAGNLGQLLAERIRQAPGYGMSVLAFFDDKWPETPQTIGNIPVIGNIDQLPQFVAAHDVDIVYVALPLRAEDRLKNLFKNLIDLRVSLFFVPDIFAFQLLQTRIEDLGGIPVFSLFATPLRDTERIIKRFVDIVLSLVILLMISPLLVVIAIAVRVTTKGPTFFIQRRYGLNGEEIKVIKFRTMNVCEDGPHIVQAKRNDDRVTRLGAFLRRTSLDELPQFFNVLRGEMSIVGPRPHSIAHNEHYRQLIHGYMLRHKVKPGITGWAQVNGWRGETDTLEKMKKRVEFDLEYIRNWSVGFDFKIIVLTILRGFRSENAY